MMGPVFVSYYTHDYAPYAGHLIGDLVGLEIDHRVVPLKPWGDWYDHTRHKPRFLLQMMAEYRDRPIVWVDADARIRERPDLLWELDCDVAAHILRKAPEQEELLSGTVYLGPTDAAWEVVFRWANICETDGNPYLWDQRALKQAMGESGRKGLFRELPPDLCYIFDRTHLWYPNARPVIEHFQRSRKHRPTPA